MVIDVSLTALFDAQFVEVMKKAHMQLGRDFSIAKIFFLLSLLPIYFHDKVS